MFDAAVLQVHETILAPVPAHVLDMDRAGLASGLLARVTQIKHRLLVLRVVLDAAEVDRRGRAAAPRRDEPLVNRVELVRAGVEVLQPEPLRHRCLHQGRRRVGVVFQQLGRRVPVEAQVKPSVEAEVVPLPGAEDAGDGYLGDAQPGPPLMLDHRLGPLDTQVMQRVGSRFEHVNLFGAQLVGGGFVPIRPRFMRMISQADLLDLLAPARPGNGTMPLHHEPTQYDPELLPNPPRTISVRCASACCTIPGAGAEMLVMLSQAVADHWPP